MTNVQHAHSALSRQIARWVVATPLPDLLRRLDPYLEIAVAVIGYMCLHHLVSRLGYLPDTAYEQSFLVTGLFQRLGVFPSVAGLAAIALLWRYGGLGHRWQVFDHGRLLRGLIVLLCALIAWYLATMGYNHYFAQAYLLERGLLVLLVVCIYIRPVFVLPFLALAYAMLWQLDHPSLSAGAAFLHKTHLLNVVTLFGVVLVMHALSGSRDTRVFWLLVLGLIATNYWDPAVTKVELNWLEYPSLHFMPVAAYAHGWLATWQPADIIALANWIEPFNPALQLAVLILELGVILCAVRRWLTVGLLLGLSLFHGGVFALYGYLFWTWVGLNIAVCVVLLRMPDHQRLFNWRFALAGAVLVYFGSIWNNPSQLGWYDTPLSYTYRYQVNTAAGNSYTLPPRFFLPYDDIFTMANFGYLPDNHRMLTFPYAITSRPEIAESLNAARTAEDVFVLERQLGLDRYSPARSAVFSEFLVKYLQTYNLHGPQLAWLYQLAPPPQFKSQAKNKPVYPGGETITEVSVIEVTTLFNGTDIQEIRSIELDRLKVPGL